MGQSSSCCSKDIGGFSGDGFNFTTIKDGPDRKMEPHSSQKYLTQVAKNDQDIPGNGDQDQESDHAS